MICDIFNSPFQSMTDLKYVYDVQRQKMIEWQAKSWKFERFINTVYGNNF